MRKALRRLFCCLEFGDRLYRVVGVNSVNLIPVTVVENIILLDDFAFTMVMTALGMETCFNKFKGLGYKPIYLASALFVYLMLVGYFMS